MSLGFIKGSKAERSKPVWEWTKETKNVGALCSWYSITFSDDSLNVKELISVVHGLHPLKLYVCSVPAPNLSISTVEELSFELKVVQEISEFLKNEQFM